MPYVIKHASSTKVLSFVKSCSDRRTKDLVDHFGKLSGRRWLSRTLAVIANVVDLGPRVTVVTCAKFTHPKVVSGDLNVKAFTRLK